MYVEPMASNVTTFKFIARNLNMGVVEQIQSNRELPEQLKSNPHLVLAHKTYWQEVDEKKPCFIKN